MSYDPNTALFIASSDLFKEFKNFLDNKIFLNNLLITSEAVLGGTPLDIKTVELDFEEILKYRDQHLLVSFVGFKLEFHEKYIKDINSFWKDLIRSSEIKKDRFLFVYPSERDQFSEERPFDLDKQNIDKTDAPLHCMESWALTPFGTFVNFKIRQTLPYVGDNSEPYLYSLSSKREKDRFKEKLKTGFYIGGYPNSWTLFLDEHKQAIHVFLRICSDIDLGPSLLDYEYLKKTKEYKDYNRKIFVVQGASVTPRRFFGGEGENAPMGDPFSAEKIKAWSPIEKGKNLREIRWPEKFEIRLDFFSTLNKEDAKSWPNSWSSACESYLNFISHFNYIVFADSQGPLDKDGKYGNQAGCIYQIKNEDGILYFNAIKPIESKNDKFFGYSTYELQDILVVAKKKNDQDFKENWLPK